MAEKNKISGVYPSSACQSQFITYYNDSTQEALYICTRDEKRNQKIFYNHQGNIHIPYARCEISLLPSLKKTTYWISPYKTEIKCFNGNWYEASKFYRDWVTTSTSYCQPNKSKKLNWIFKTHLWFQLQIPNDTTFNFRNTDFLNLITKYSDYCETNSAIHLYNWQKYPHDSKYPNYFPARKGFKEFLTKMDSQNIKVIPYINGRIADIEIVETEPGYKDNMCLYDIKNKFIYKTRTYHSNKFVTMCPSTEFWQEKIFRICKKLLNYQFVNGIYLDQICNNSADKCINPDHGHPPDRHTLDNYSTGEHWVKGYKEMLSKIENEAIKNRDIALMSEDAAEPWNHLIDAFVMFNSRSTHTLGSYRMVPMYSAIYSGYTIPIGLQYIGMAPDKWLPAMLSKLARSFVWGAQLGRLRPERMQDNIILLDYLKKLAQNREQVSNYLNFGEMKRNPEITPTPGEIIVKEKTTFDGKPIIIKFPLQPIQTALWVLNTDSAAILITNFTEQAFTDGTLKLILDLTDTNLTPGVYSLNSGRQVKVKTLTQKLQIPFSIKGYDSKVIELVRE